MEIAERGGRNLRTAPAPTALTRLLLTCPYVNGQSKRKLFIGILELCC